ncbi:hypothetical protein CROQUDRAFT_97445 [Cronartium quercuum f. sp. fusiforme G11]|uniref:Uncharacterized protein n=1 Tax=Cronartium quercuum f. sp. fusiforme G11 TaxID=708437 RepID=A0A9P6T8E4_9BASI|nr:hypothetical protein CROQUDRAFT_97445 [Cronartium quercuum f. sp. fusiforme G11]
MSTEEEYQEWASKALHFGSNNQKPACTWKMAKPDDPAVIAAQEAGVAKNDAINAKATHQWKA